eukprot:Gb_03792 [translate_table: standard]
MCTMLCIPLAIFNRKLESSARDVKALLDSARLPPVKGPDESTPTKSELNASLGEFTVLFSRQLASMEERGIAWKGQGSFFVSPVFSSSRDCHHHSWVPPYPSHPPLINQNRDMKHGAGQKDAEGDQPILYSSHHEARWEAYLMAKEMMKSLEANITTLDRSVREMQEELYHVKSATQHPFIMASQITRGSSHVRSHPAPIPRSDPLSGPSSTGQPILERINKDSPMHDEERD